jgi:hypothetical protein
MNSEAFEKLYALSLETPMTIESLYRLVGFYICNVLVTARAIQAGEDPYNFKPCYRNKKDIVIEHVCGVTDAEWITIQSIMFDDAKKMNATNLEKKRVDMICELDILRAFRP